MDKVFLDKELGKELALKVEIKEGKVLFMLAHEGALGGVALSGSVGVDQLIEAIKLAVPGKIDDAILDVVKVALKA